MRAQLQNIEGWNILLEGVLDTPSFSRLESVVNDADKRGVLCPSHPLIFRALKITELDSIKVVIIGQDPYHDKGRALGVAFGNAPEVKSLSPSLKNIIKELKEEFPEEEGDIDPSLLSWAHQGVLLLNTALTTELGKPGEHTIHWRDFTRTLVRRLSAERSDLIWVLWGRHAQGFKKYIVCKRLILEAAHPSPFSAHQGFFGCDHFKAMQTIHPEINWFK
jgi:uracil-DNA glycosylase